MATQTMDPMTTMFEQASDSFTRTFETGMKFAQDNARFWNDMCNRGVDGWRDQAERFAGQATPFSKENVERFQQMFAQQSEKSMALMREAFETCQTTRPAEWTDRVSDLWRHSFDTMKNANESMAKANNDMMQSWNKMFQNFSKASMAADGNGSPARPAARK